MAAAAAARLLLFVLISLGHSLSAERNSPAAEDHPFQRTLAQNRYRLAESSTNATRPTSTIAAAPSTAPAPSPSSSPPAHQTHNRRKARTWGIGFAAGSVAGIATGLILTVLFRMLLTCIRGPLSDPSGPTIFSPLIKSPDDLAFLDNSASLASLTLIGRGGCGEVYLALLPSGKPVAVKHIRRGAPDTPEPTAEESLLLDKWMRQIRSEILTVGRIRHRNLLPLLAHVPRPDCHYLVYEFMKNGSLHDALSDDRPLGWLARHNIAMGVAAGLEHLHHSHKPHIIHRDLKPGNILLDDELEARIADFGLAKELPDATTHMTMSNVAGTVGYIAPEYYQTLKFTSKCDVYSLGVILGVLVIGRMPSDDFFQETAEMSLVKWLRNVMASETPAAAVDERLKGAGYEEQVLLVARIACFCTADDPKDRPSSRDVRAMLAQIKHEN